MGPVSQRWLAGRTKATSRQHLVRKDERSLPGVVVQLVRIPACHAGGRGFESRPLRQSMDFCCPTRTVKTLKKAPNHGAFLFSGVRCAVLQPDPCGGIFEGIG